MFQCQSCRKTTEAGQPVNRVIITKREKNYVNQRKRPEVDAENPPRWNNHYPEAIESSGWEIAQELTVCPECYGSMTGLQPKLITEERKARPLAKPKPFNEKPHYKKPYNKNQQDNKNNNQPPRKKPVVEVVSTFKQSRPN